MEPELRTDTDVKIAILHKSVYERFIKRTIDLIFAFFIVLITLPLLMISIFLIKLESKGSAVFKQKRIGKNNAEFTIYKLRTMKTETEVEGKELSDTERLTKIGKFLRKTSLDEIPQCLNILKGQMSFIGPRPLPLRYLPYYTEQEIKRHDVLPGISGLAQVKGRNLLSWEERFKWDVHYVDFISARLDVKILLLTIFKVFKTENIVLKDKNPLRDLNVERSEEYGV